MTSEEMLYAFLEDFLPLMQQRADIEDIGIFLFCYTGDDLMLAGNTGIEAIEEVGNLMTAISTLATVVDKQECTPYLQMLTRIVQGAIRLNLDVTGEENLH